MDELGIIETETNVRPLTTNSYFYGVPAIEDADNDPARVGFFSCDMRDGADHTPHHVGSIDKDGIVTVTEGHTVDELAMCFLTPSATPWERERYTLTIGMLKGALGVTWNDRTTAEFWDAVRERLATNAAKGEDR